MTQEAQRCSMIFCFACHRGFADRDFFVVITVVKSMEKRCLQLAKPVAWFMWLSMCTGMHEIEFLLMIAFVLIILLQLKQWWQNNYFVVATVITQSVLKLHCPVADIKPGSSTILKQLQNSQSFACMIIICFFEKLLSTVSSKNSA